MNANQDIHQQRAANPTEWTSNAKVSLPTFVCTTALSFKGSLLLGGAIQTKLQPRFLMQRSGFKTKCESKTTLYNKSARESQENTIIIRGGEGVIYGRLRALDSSPYPYAYSLTKWHTFHITRVKIEPLSYTSSIS